MGRFVSALGLGFGMMLAGGLVYFLATDQVARLLALALVMFILGAGIVGILIVYANRSLAQVLKPGPGGYTAQPPPMISVDPGYPMPAGYPALPPAGNYAWPSAGRPTVLLDGNDDPVA